LIRCRDLARRSDRFLLIQLRVARKLVAVVLGITKPEGVVEIGVPLFCSSPSALSRSRSSRSRGEVASQRRLCQTNLFGCLRPWYLWAMSNPFRYFNSSPGVIRLVVMMYVRYPLSLRNVEDLPAERGIDISHETIRFWWNRFGPKRKDPRAGRMRAIDFCRCPPAVEPYRGGRTLFLGRQPSRRKALSLEARHYTATIL
jgi:hypothetical protein